jgi:hypothetical protein
MTKRQFRFVYLLGVGVVSSIIGAVVLSLVSLGARPFAIVLVICAIGFPARMILERWQDRFPDQ